VNFFYIEKSHEFQPIAQVTFVTMVEVVKNRASRKNYATVQTDFKVPDVNMVMVYLYLYFVLKHMNVTFI